MAANRVYISASTQKENVGVGQYGTEQDRMMFLADRVKYFIELADKNKQFVVFRNQPGWSLGQTIADVNNLACDIAIDNHTNAADSSVAGTVGFHHTGSVNGERLSKLLYNRIAPISLGPDKGEQVDTTLYKSGLGFLRDTNPPATLIEHIFHTNLAEVNDYLGKVDEFAKAEAQAVYDYFSIPFVLPQVKADPYVDFQYVADYAKEAVTALKNLGIMVGDGNRFNPKGTLSREDYAVSLYNVLKKMKLV